MAEQRYCWMCGDKVDYFEDEICMDCEDRHPDLYDDETEEPYREEEPYVKNEYGL